ncbi:MAG: SusD/RagB family nutrient-binding outer membrane lipoprotein [Prevotellaceae bacterium]|jgi:hypothetical protein|nr:SusD/RagB family nutrient-binding outer membrane lipoprotein [Prevotellaceae bacterium]
MKRNFIKVKLFTLLVVAVLFNSCDLDINDNPNDPTGTVITPDLTLPAVVASTLYNQIYYYGYLSSAYIVGYQVPGSGISGFGAQYTYAFTSAFNTGAWTAIFSDLRDYNTMIKKAEANSAYAIFGGIAHILKVYSYHLLTDFYGDVPYLEGLQGGSGNLSPAYDKAEDVYKYLVAELNDAIKILKENEGNIGAGVIAPNSKSDPVFAGNVTKWIQFANNTKLRLLTRARGTEINDFVVSELGKFSSEGFLKEDVLINPGYNASSQQNPYWTVYHSAVSGAITQPANYFIPSKYVISFYDGTKLNDDVRGALVYKNFPSTPSWQLGDESPSRPQTPRYVWETPDSKGIFKSRSAAAPLTLAAETYFLLAEAALNGNELDGDAKTNFVKGITASFDFLSRTGASYALPSGVNPEDDVQDYIDNHSGNYLVDWDAATTNAEKLEAIITQKYIAFNLLFSHEAWNEFRRTGYPAISGTAPTSTFVSVQSQSTRTDKLPVRLVYPQTEYNLNINTPTLANAYSNPVFWVKDKN